MCSRSFPLGHVEKRETLSETAQREAGEETGFYVSMSEKIGTKIIPAEEFRSSHKFSKGKIRLTIFKAEVKKKLQNDAELKRKWFALKDFRAAKLRGPWMENFL